jgi:hypothetical protein
MPKKTRKQKQRSASRRQSPAIPGGAGLPAQPAPEIASHPLDDADASAPEEPTVVSLVTATTPVAAPGASAVSNPARRRIERLDTAVAAAQPLRPGRVPSNAAAMFAPLPPDDAAIPFDRVPYVPADLRRVAVMAVVMIVVIVIAAFVVSHIVT